MSNNLAYSMHKQNWTTPIDLFEKLNSEFRFNLDVCADEYNHKCDLFFYEKENGLAQNWGGTEFSAIPHIPGRLNIGWKKPISRV